MSAVKIFCVYFDRRPVWRSDCVEPLQAGKARTGLDLAMLADDTGDNISAENVRYGEMTAWYWVWKNYLPAHPELSLVGFSHYRRFLDFAGFCRGGGTRRTTYRRFRRVFDAAYRESEILARIGDADLVMRKVSRSGFSTVRAQFVDAHPANTADFDRFVSLVRERSPAAAGAVDAALSSGDLAMELQFVMKRELFVEFMEWTFSLCREFERRWRWSGPADGDQARAPAFLVERLFLVFLAVVRAARPLKTLELPLVKLTGRPWWYRFLKPVMPFLPRETVDRLYARFK
ncbi:MAG: DUF4422 domain-containing protein [Kiritimatiellae bacterium]|nr:DUF4422 domain-containing protein [Kiritimatiellia bacterium]